MARNKITEWKKKDGTVVSIASMDKSAVVGRIAFLDRAGRNGRVRKALVDRLDELTRLDAALANPDIAADVASPAVLVDSSKTRKEQAADLGISVSTLRRWIESGKALVQ